MIFCLPAGSQSVTETQRTPRSLTLVSAAELDQTEKVMSRALTSSDLYALAERAHFRSSVCSAVESLERVCQLPPEWLRSSQRQNGQGSKANPKRMTNVLIRKLDDHGIQ